MSSIQRLSLASIFVTAGVLLAAPRALANGCDLFTTSSVCGPAQGIAGSIGTASYQVSSGGGSLTGASKVYDLDGGSGSKADNWINLDYTLIGGGSGSGDMVLFVLDTGQFNQQYTYLYSQFGCANCGSTKYPSQAGFEEWWVPGGRSNTPTVPGTATVVLLGSGLLYFGERYPQPGPLNPDLGRDRKP